MLYRTMPTEFARNDDGRIQLSSSSEYAVERNGYREILDHSPEAITNIARSVLYNHDADWLIGSVRNSTVIDKHTRAEIELLPDVKLPSGADVREAIDTGALTGVSIGYSIDEYRVSELDDVTEVRATKWTLREITLTPIPADHTVGIGRSEDQKHWQEFLDSNQITQAAQRGENKEDTVSENIEPQNEGGQIETPAVDAKRDVTAIAKHAESLNLRVSDYLEADDWQANMLKDAAAARSVEPVAVAPVKVGADRDEKLQERTVQGITKGNLGAISEFARAHGIDLPAHSRGDLAAFIFNPARGTRAAETSGNFSQITQLASEKSILKAYDNQKVNWNMIANDAETGDFKPFRNGALQFADFSEVAEGAAAGDLTIDDAGGSGSLTMRGVVLELTKQAIYNDELGEFFRKMGQMGGMAARHVEKSVFNALAAMSFSSATDSIALSAAGLNSAWTNYMGINGPAGELRSSVPSRLVAPSALYITSKEITTTAQGETTARVFASGDDYIRPVHGKYLTDANDWYLVADPNEAPVLTALFHRDYRSPKVFEIDAGAVMSRKFRIEFALGVIENNDAPNVPMGAYKCTQA